MYTIKEIASIINASAILVNEEATIEHLITDSRKITFAASSLFFAIKTEHRNGNIFIEDAYQQGIRNFVVEENTDTGKYKEANFLLVKNTLEALQQLAAVHRATFNYPVIGITGSNGKTIVKEWLYFILNDRFKIVRSPRSYNSQIGVPLSVWEMNTEDNLGIFEAGISEKNEMENLQKIIRPDIGVFTHLGEAHAKGFESRQQKLEEKIRLFQSSKIVFANADNEQVITTLKSKTDAEIIAYGKTKAAQLCISKIVKEYRKTTVFARYKKQELVISIPFTDEASIQNACICWLVALHFQLDTNSIVGKMAQLQAIDMRLQVLPAINNCTIINDSYSLDVDSLSIGLDLLNQQLLPKKVILSDFYSDSEQNYQTSIEILFNKKINRLITIGNRWNDFQNKLKEKIDVVETYKSTAEFIHRFQPNQYKGEAILLKGARSFHFEDLLNLLIEKVHQTRLEINLSNIVHNLKEYRKRILPATKIMAMVKAFAYGSGSVEIAGILQYHKIDYLAVAYADEGVELRRAGINVPIMVMNVDEYGFDTIVEHNLEPEIFSFEILKSLTIFLQKQGVAQFPVHLKLDTGMHRLGFEEAQMDELIYKLKENRNLVIKSAFSHLTSSEDPADDDFTRHQGAVFLRCCNKLQSALQYTFIRHLDNSAGIARKPELQFDMVRLGIGLYGLNLTSAQIDLKTVASLKSTIAQIKYLQPGETVGYNRRGKINAPMNIATIRIGYADGYNRKLGNGNGHVLIHGQKAPVIGSVCMDMMMVDITHIPLAKEGDDVEIFGENLSVTQLAGWCETIPYEILTSVGQRVKRVYVEE